MPSKHFYFVPTVLVSMPHFFAYLLSLFLYLLFQSCCSYRNFVILNNKFIFQYKKLTYQLERNNLLWLSKQSSPFWALLMLRNISQRYLILNFQFVLVVQCKDIGIRIYGTIQDIGVSKSHTFRVTITLSLAPRPSHMTIELRSWSSCSQVIPYSKEPMVRHFLTQHGPILLTN